MNALTDLLRLDLPKTKNVFFKNAHFGFVLNIFSISLEVERDHFFKPEPKLSIEVLLVENVFACYSLKPVEA